jgi:hypothetical protein
VTLRPIARGLAIGALLMAGLTFGVTEASAGGPAPRTSTRNVSCTESSTGITVGPYSVLCSGQAATGATVTIAKATSTKFVAQVTLAAGTTLESESLSLNGKTGECTYVIGLSGGTAQPVTVSAGGGTLEANLDQSGGTLNPGDPSCSFKHV